MERREVTGYTIDSQQTRDIDDALWIEQRDDGLWHVVVSIADVSEAVPADSKHDVRAREMVATKYFSTGNSPMLPRHYAEDHLSLWPNKKRNTITVDMSIGSDTTNVVKTEIYPSVLTSRGRITYDQVPGILKDKTHPSSTLLDVGTKLAMRLLDARRKAGAFVCYDLNNGWVSTEEGFLRKLEKKEETIGYILIQEMMVLANAQVAEFAVKNEIPVPFRNHMAMSAMPDRQILMSQIQDALTTPMADLDVVRQRTHMLLSKANYGDSLLGHYGLNLPAYLHFTSPIRRYADLVTHRQIKAFLTKAAFPYTKDRIREITDHINDVIELEREQASMHFKNKDEEKAKRNINDRRLDGLDAVHFERATKVEVRAGYDPSDAFEEAYLRRLKENRLPLICLTLILTQEGATEGWKPLRQATIDQLAKKPEDAISVLTQATQIAEWAETKFTVKHEGPDHARTFTATTVMPFRTVGVSENVLVEDVVGTGVGTTSKQAKAHAAIDLLAKLGGDKTPEKVHKLQPREPEKPEDPPPAPSFKELDVVRMAESLPDKGLVVGSTVCILHVYPDGAYEVEAITVNGRETLALQPSQVMPLSAPIPEANQIKIVVPDRGKDPVSALMEYSQKTKAPPPDFQFSKEGPDHIPSITCTCSIKVPAHERITRKATAANKAEAKKLAAKAVLAELPV